VRRHLFNLAAGASVVVIGAIAVVWCVAPAEVNSTYDPYDRPADADAKEQARFLAMTRGGVRVIRQRVVSDLRALPAATIRGDAGTMGFILMRDGRQQAGVIVRLDMPPNHGRAGFGWSEGAMFSPNPAGGQFRWEYSVVAIPYWPALVLAAIAPAVWVRRWWIVRRRRAEGRCVNCGYDLRGSVVGGRCPECGMKPQQAPQLAA
jgi:hypothetical protein